MSSPSSLLDAALDYSNRFGWSVIPVAGKKPTVDWGQYQTESPSDSELSAMFANPRGTGLAAIGGTVSNDLVIRDFDTQDGYQQWVKDYPKAASMLPTARTNRGYHVYARWPNRRLQKLADGELRGEGGYTLLPKSAHPNGGHYQWIHPPSEEIPKVTSDIGILPSLPLCGTQEGFMGFMGVIEGEIDQRIQEAIYSTLPTGPGQRHYQVFELVRALRAFLPEEYDREQLKAIAREWHRLATPHMRTKSFSTTWSDFASGWLRVKSARGRSFSEAVKRADTEPMPVACCKYDNARHKRLVAICYQLHVQWQGKPFPLSIRQAAKGLGIEKSQAHRDIQMLLFMGTIQLVEIGDNSKAHAQRRIASTYQWVG